MSIPERAFVAALCLAGAAVGVFVVGVVAVSALAGDWGKVLVIAGIVLLVLAELSNLFAFCGGIVLLIRRKRMIWWWLFSVLVILVSIWVGWSLWHVSDSWH